MTNFFQYLALLLSWAWEILCSVNFPIGAYVVCPAKFMLALCVIYFGISLLGRLFSFRLPEDNSYDTYERKRETREQHDIWYQMKHR